MKFSEIYSDETLVTSLDTSLITSLGTTLISRKEWEKKLDILRRSVGKPDNDALREALIEAVIKRAKAFRNQKIGVLFSGGVDSTLIAWILKENGFAFTCYTVGFQDEGTKEPEDVVESRKVAKRLGFLQKMSIVTLDSAEKRFKECAEILKRYSQELVHVVNIGVGSVVVEAVHMARADGCTVLFGGLGSEEIFAGYERHEKANTDPEALQEECWNGLRAMYDRDLRRDVALGEALGAVVPTPFLDENVIPAAMAIPATEKIKECEGVSCKKYVLRVIAEELGLPHEFAFRPKRAAQYGSRFDSALQKLAKRSGLKKGDYVMHSLSPVEPRA